MEIKLFVGLCGVEWIYLRMRIFSPHITHKSKSFVTFWIEQSVNFLKREVLGETLTTMDWRIVLCDNAMSAVSRVQFNSIYFIFPNEQKGTQSLYKSYLFFGFVA